MSGWFGSQNDFLKVNTSKGLQLPKELVNSVKGTLGCSFAPWVSCMTDSTKNQLSEVYYFFSFFSLCEYGVGCHLHVGGHEYEITHACVFVHECGYPRLNWVYTFHCSSTLFIEADYVYESWSLQTWVVYLFSLLCRSPISAFQAWILSCAC